MSTIRKTKGGNYQTDVIDQNGKRIRMVFTRKTEAQAFCTKVEKEKQEFWLYKAGLIKRRVTLTSAIQDALKEKESLAHRTYTKYKCIFSTLENFVKQNKLNYVNEFTTIHADEYKKALQSSGAAAKTINAYLAAAKGLFKDLVLRDLILRSPFDHVKLERVNGKSLLDRENDYFSTEEIKSFFSQEMDKEYRAAFLGLFLTGMRFAELSNLTWERADWSCKLLKIRSDENFRTKTVSSERDIPMSDKLYELIEGSKENSTSGYVFCSAKKSKLSERTLLTKCKDIAEKAGIKKNATLHKFRHSFNSHLAQLGVDYSIRQYLMGHKPQTMTDHYTKIDPRKLHQVVSLLDGLIP
jgi:integrase/recombinase XerD